MQKKNPSFCPISFILRPVYTLRFVGSLWPKLIYTLRFVSPIFFALFDLQGWKLTRFIKSVALKSWNSWKQEDKFYQRYWAIFGPFFTYSRLFKARRLFSTKWLASKVTVSFFFSETLDVADCMFPVGRVIKFLWYPHSPPPPPNWKWTLCFLQPFRCSIFYVTLNWPRKKDLPQV